MATNIEETYNKTSARDGTRSEVPLTKPHNPNASTDTMGGVDLHDLHNKHMDSVDLHNLQVSRYHQLG